MEQYINKDALVVEIERFIERAKAERVLYPKTILAAKNYLLIEDYNKLLSFLDTLEVKEVEFGTEVYKYIDEHFNVYDDENQTLQTKDKKSLIGRVDVENIAKHFFELGLKVAQKGE